MKDLKGTHTSLIPLAQDIFDILTKAKTLEKIQVSPGFITKKNISVKQVSIKLKQDTAAVMCEVLMKGSKQYLRIYNTNVLEVRNLLKELCKSKQILLK